MSSIGSLFWVPIAADACTAKQSRVSYARLLIEIDISKLLPKSVLIEDEEGKVHEQAYDAEWIPYFCQKCQAVGHLCGENKREHEKVVAKRVKKGKEKGKEIVVTIPTQPASTSCEVEEGEWIQVTGRKNKVNVVTGVELDGSSYACGTNNGAGMPMNPILGG